MPWVKSEECGAELLLPGCATYCRLVQQGPLIDAGSHAVAICRVEDVFASDSAAPALSSAELRDAGLITTAGRAVDPS